MLRAVGWLSVDDVLPDWPRLRKRFVDLLEESRRADEAVLVTVPPPCDQGPIGGPVVDVVEWLRD
ncbi:MAG: hypothetical protein H6721_21520 [Sandaracinus sp.]|nr:hypothetical protein [Sandaracinus sp.]